MPMHAVQKDFDASAKSDSGSSLNDQFLIGPMVAASLIDVLLRFRRHKIAMTTDVGKLYRAVLLTEEQRDVHCFLWRDYYTM